MISAVPFNAVLAAGALMLAGCGDGSSTRVCFGSEDFCRDAFAANQSPVADAGRNLEAVAGERVTLDGSESYDPDGGITSYSWSQSSGPPVALSQATASVAAFDAPDLDAPTSLVFRLLVTDGQGASNADTVSVTVTPGGFTALEQQAAHLDRERPPPCEGAAAADCWERLGLWLGARVEAERALARLDSTALLDVLRVMSVTHDQRPPDALPTESLLLFELGQRALAGFADTLDPATAAWARRLAPGAPPDPAEWRAALRLLEDRAAGAAGGQTADAVPNRRAAATLERALDLQARRRSAPEE